MRLNIELHIEELILRGFAPATRYRIVEALQAELARLLEEQGVPRQWLDARNIEFLDLSFNVKAPHKPESVGAQVAQSLHMRSDS